jgi:hypothetical protein
MCRLGVEPVHADQRVAHVQGTAAEDRDGGVVIRRGQQMGVGLPVRDAEEREQPGGQHNCIVWIKAGECTPHALRTARGA